MKQKNRDVDVVEWAKFSTLENIVIPLRLLELFFDDALVDMIVGYTNLQNHREKEDISFEITNKKICLFLSMLMLSGCTKLLDCKMYLETTRDTFLEAKSDSMPCKTFELIFRNLLPCGSEQLD